MKLNADMLQHTAESTVLLSQNDTSNTGIVLSKFHVDEISLEKFHLDCTSSSRFKAIVRERVSPTSYDVVDADL